LLKFSVVVVIVGLGIVEAEARDEVEMLLLLLLLLLEDMMDRDDLVVSFAISATVEICAVFFLLLMCVCNGLLCISVGFLLL